MRLKKFLRSVTGLGEVFIHDLQPPSAIRPACIFYYHRVAEIGFCDPHFDDRNVSPQLFERHLAALSEHTEIVPLPELHERIGRNQPGNKKPLVSLTFDDGYANFRLNVLPLLERFKAPATLSVVTSYVESRDPAPFDRWAQKNKDRVSPETWRMLNWREIEECVSSGLVLLGSHSHTHRKGSECTPDQLQQEANRSAGMLRKRFGKPHAQIYAYPFGNTRMGHVSEDYERAVSTAGFTLAVTTDVGMISPKSDRFRLPRIEAHAQDSAATLLAKSAGAIAPLYVNDWFHRALAWQLNGRNKKQIIATVYGFLHWIAFS